MKNVLLLFACLFSFSLMAQQKVAADMYPVEIKDKTISMDEANASINHQPKVDRKKLLEGLVRNAGGSAIQLGSSYNLYSVLLEFQNQVAYVPELNTVSMIHRQNNGEPGGSGIYSYDYSTDGGVTWDASNAPFTPTLEIDMGNTGNGNRYPNGTIYNPPGNTDIANAHFVGVGAALHTDPVYGNGWGWEVVASTPLQYSGLGIQEDYYTTADTNSYIPGGLTLNPNGDIFYVNTRRDQDEADDPNNFRELTVSKLVFNGTGFDRTTQALMVDQSGITQDDPILLNANLAFGPDGTVGYAVGFGTETAQSNLSYGFNIQPVVFKTTDGGDNWVQQAPAELSCLDSLIAYTVQSDGQEGDAIPYIAVADIVVDAVGDLHFFTEAQSRFTSAQDSIGFRYAGRFSSEMFHLVTDGTVWRAEHIYFPLTDEGTIGTTTMDHRPQASRTADGTKVFMTWVETDTLATGLTTNDAPDTWAVGYDVALNCYTPFKNVSEGTGADFQTYFATMSPVSITSGATADYEMPIVYAVPTSDDLSPIDYWYINGAGFDEAEFSAGFCGTSNSTDGSCAQVVNVDPAINDASFAVFPNPSSGMVNIDLSAFNERVDIQIMNTLGATILNVNRQETLSQINMSNYANGVYFVRIQSEAGLMTKKFVLSK